MHDAEFLIQKLMRFYKVFTISELAHEMGVSQPSISGWKKNNYTKAIGNKCRELGIYDEIFGDLNSNTQNIRTISGGQNAQNVRKNQINISNSDDFVLDEDIQKVLKSALPILDDDDKKEDFIKHIKKWIVENL